MVIPPKPSGSGSLRWFAQTAALEFVSHDLSGFGAAVQDFRKKLRGGPG